MQRNPWPILPPADQVGEKSGKEVESAIQFSEK